MTTSAGRPGMRFTVLVALMMVISACGEDGGAGADPLEGSRWEATSLRDGDSLRATDPTTITMAAFAGGDASGFDGCNHYRVSYTIDGDSIVFGEPIQTGSACDAQFVAQGDLFISAIQAAARFNVGGGSLELRDASGAVLVAFRPAAELPLTDVAWLLTGYAGGDGGLVTPLSGTRISLWFRTDGTLGGVAGCNDYGAGYRRDGGTLLIESLAQTEMACMEPDGVMAQEVEYVAALGRAAAYTTTLTTLELLDEDGDLVAEYRFAGRIR